jgi:hypothetical protein
VSQGDSLDRARLFVHRAKGKLRLSRALLHLAKKEPERRMLWASSMNAVMSAMENLLMAELHLSDKR